MDAFRLTLLARQGLKMPLLCKNLFKEKAENGITFLIYHRVSGDLSLEVDLPLSLFRRQLEFLAGNSQLIGYDQALKALSAAQPLPPNAFVLTFDDGYEDFYTHVFPLLRALAVPAILFVTTGFVETGRPYPLLRHGLPNVKPVNWKMLRKMVESGLVTVGAHTHTHPVLTDESEARVIEELAKPLEICRQRLGVEVQHFAYPKALWNQEVEALVAKFYSSAVVCDEKKATPYHFNPYRIPRIPIRRSDGWFFFLAKTQGWLAGEEAMYDTLRQLKARRQTAEP
jgi:peptidoglycan/xylan/chitin deacetylase (PgdA/CDA1 family)